MKQPPALVKNTSFPSTRFLGSKAKLLDWIWINIQDMQFDSVLDVFGGTGSFSYLMKKKGKQVFYNDILNFNQVIAKAIIENKSIKISQLEVLNILKKHKNREYKEIIKNNFRGVYYREKENEWLDIVVQNIFSIRNLYKRAILLSALYQACLIKRPFNLFHRNNLKLRTRRVKRNFGNKTTWEKSFELHFLKFIKDFNNGVFNNGKNNSVLGGFDALNMPTKKYDLVYLDPPYISKRSQINYLNCYHFLEGLTKYYSWERLIDRDSKNRKMKKNEEIEKWIDKKRVHDLFADLIHKYRNSIIVLSYRNDGIPSVKEIREIFKKETGGYPIIRSKNYKYALSNGSNKEVLFIKSNQ